MQYSAAGSAIWCRQVYCKVQCVSTAHLQNVPSKLARYPVLGRAASSDPPLRATFSPANPERAETRSCPRRPPFHRGGSASTEDYWSRPSSSIFMRSSVLLRLSRGWSVWSPTARVQRGPSEDARCASTGAQQATLVPPLLTALSTGPYNHRTVLPATC